MSEFKSCFVRQLKLKYAMSVTRSEKTGRIINQPEVFFQLRNDFLMIKSHKVLFNLIKILEPDYCKYNDYIRYIRDYPAEFKPTIEYFLTQNKDAYIDFIEIDKNVIISLPDYWDKRDKEKISLPINGFGDSTASFYKTKHGKTISFAKNNCVFEVILNRNNTKIYYRYVSDTGYTFTINKPVIFDKNLNKLNINTDFAPEMWSQRVEKIEAKYLKHLPRQRKQKTTNLLNYDNRLMIEEERLFSLFQ